MEGTPMEYTMTTTVIANTVSRNRPDVGVRPDIPRSGPLWHAKVRGDRRVDAPQWIGQHIPRIDEDGATTRRHGLGCVCEVKCIVIEIDNRAKI